MSDTQDPSVKSEENEEATLSSSTANLKVKVTPMKRKVTKKETNDGGEAEESPTKKAKAAPKAGIPDSYEDLAAEDKMMLKMKGDGKGWKDIQEAWLTMTGNKHTGLSTRYARVKSAIARVKPEHIEALQDVMGEVGERIKEEKRNVEKRRYTFISEMLEGKGIEKYDAAILEKECKRLQAAGKNGST